MQSEVCHEWGFNERLDLARARRAYSETPGGYRGVIHGTIHRFNDSDEQVVGGDAVDLDAAQQARIKGFKEYLVMCEGRHSISTSVHNLGWLIWEKLNSRLGYALAVPDACPGPSGELLLTWDKDSDHFEVEVEPSLDVSFFYVNSHKNISWESPTTLNASIDNRTEQALRIFQLPTVPARALAASTAPRSSS
jgi:hypothetical protein